MERGAPLIAPRLDRAAKTAALAHMFGLFLLGLSVVGGLGGWLIGRLTKRRWPLVAWIPLPLWPCLLLLLPAGFLGGVEGLINWLIIVAMLGYPIAAWTIAAGLCALLARHGRRLKRP